MFEQIDALIGAVLLMVGSRVIVASAMELVEVKVTADEMTASQECNAVSIDKSHLKHAAVGFSGFVLCLVVTYTVGLVSTVGLSLLSLIYCFDQLKKHYKQSYSYRVVAA